MSSPFDYSPYNQQKATPVQSSDIQTTIGVPSPSETPTKRVTQDGSALRFCSMLVPHGGMLSSMVNLASATLGASIITLPMAFKLSGISTSIVFLVGCSVATVYSIHLLVTTQHKTGLQSYEEMARVLLGHKTEYMTAILMFLFCFGTCIAYIIALGDLMKPFLADNENLSSYMRSRWGNHLVVFIIWLCCMLPISLPREINSLRYVSLFGVCAIVYFVCIMVVHSSTNGLPDHGTSDLKVASAGTDTFLGLALVMFAFLCQVNVFEIYSEMRNPSPTRMTNAAGISMASCLVLYVLAGFFGYADFGAVVKGAVLENYHPRQNAVFAVAYVGIIVKIIAAFALCIQPARDSIFFILNWGNYHHVTTARRVALCASLATLALICGIFIPTIETVFSLLGSLCGGILGFVLPGLFIMYSGEWSLERVGFGNFVATWFLVLGGVVVAVFGTGAAIFNML